MAARALSTTSTRTPGWPTSIATAIGVAAGAGAAQLGLGYGLGIIAWIPSSSADSEAAWVASLAWASWIAATSVAAGAICADRLAGSPGPDSTLDGSEAPEPGRVTTALWRLAIAMASAIGALITVALVAVPARTAERADNFAPQLVAGGYAAIGVVVGLFVAYGALSARAVAANVIATVSWLWALAVAAVIDGVIAGRGLATAQLGVWEFTNDGPWFRNLYVPGMLLSLTTALAFGVLAAWPAARRGENRVGVALSGAVGPLLVAAAYFLAAPRMVGIRAEQLSAYLLAPYAVIAGLAGSVLVSALGPPAGATAPAVRPVPGDHGGLIAGPKQLTSGSQPADQHGPGIHAGDQTAGSTPSGGKGG
jgi:hypothetical protein